MVWQVMVDTHEEFVEFGRYLRHGGEYDDEGPVVLARDSLPRDGLDEFHAAEEPMQVLNYQNRRAGTICELRHGPNDCEWVLRVSDPGHGDLLDRKLHPGVAVPSADPPAFLSTQVRDFPGGFVGFVSLDPDAREAGRDEFVEAGGKGGCGGKCWWVSGGLCGGFGH